MNRHVVRYASDYLVQGVDLLGGPGFHQIALTWNRRHPEEEGGCYFDPNICALDEFGDPTACTRIAILAFDMKLSLYSEKPGYRAYTVKLRVLGSGADYQEVPLRLVTIAAPGQDLRVRLLVLNPDHSIERIIALHEEPPT